MTGELPTSLAYYGSYQGTVQILKHQTLPLFQADELQDPFLADQFSPLGFDCQQLFERSVSYMTSAVLGKSAPKGNPNHPLQKAIKRWRGENRFSNETEIRESLIGLLPAMVEQAFNDAKAIHSDWLLFVKNKRLLPFFERTDDSDLWLLEAEKHSGIVIKFNSTEDSIFTHCFPVSYNKQPQKIVNIDDCVDLMMGETNEMPIDFMQLLLAQNYRFRKQKEWRMIVDPIPENDCFLNFPSELIQNIYLGAAVPQNKKERIVSLANKLSGKINIYHAICNVKSYDFRFEK